MSDLNLVVLAGVCGIGGSGICCWLLRQRPLARLAVAVLLGLGSSLVIHAMLAVRALHATFPEARLTLQDLELSTGRVLAAIVLNLLLVAVLHLTLRRRAWAMQYRAVIGMGATVCAIVLTGVCSPWRLDFPIY